MSDDIIDLEYDSASEIDDDIDDIDDLEIEEGDEEVEGIQFLEEEQEGGASGDEEEEEDLDNIDDDEGDDSILNVSSYHKFEIVSKDKTYERLESKKRISNPMMTPQELTKLIGIRSQQIANGMAPMVSIDPEIRDTKFIAIRELQQKMMPLIVRRYFPNNYYEDWRAEELIIPKTILF